MQRNNLEIELDDLARSESSTLDEDFTFLEDSPDQQSKTQDNKTCFPVLSPSALKVLWKKVKRNPDALVYENHEPTFTVYRFNDLFVVAGKVIGAGFWGEVLFATQYQHHAAEPFGHCVIKTLREKSFFGQWLDNTLHANKKLIKESKLVGKIHEQQSDAVVIHKDGIKKTYIMLPYLANTSLASLLKNPYALRMVPCEQWLFLFATLASKLKTVHKKLNRLHNDIKPENIGLTLKERDGEVYFSAIDFFDLGNTHAINKTGGFGDPRYQPMTQCFAGLFFNNVKNQSVDIYALGMSLLEIINILKKHEQIDIDQHAYRQCEKLFTQMKAYAWQHRPSLQDCIKTLEKIQLEYQINNHEYNKFEIC